MVLIFTLQSIYSGSTYVAGPFDISGTTSGGITTLLGNNISKADLLNGVTISDIDDATTGGTIQSVDGICSNSIQWTLTGGPELAGNCNTVNVNTEAFIYLGEPLRIFYTNPNDELISAFYNEYPDTGGNPEGMEIMICAKDGTSIGFAYGSNIIIGDGNISVTLGGECLTNIDCGGGDPIIAPTSTPIPPSGGYFCRDFEGAPCIEQINPCSGFQISCGEVPAID
jgi:hypothetical protein